MLIRSKIKAAVAAWVVLEILALVAAVRILGWPLTLGIGLLTATVGIYVLRKAGRDSLTALKHAMSGSSGPASDVSSGGFLRMASGLLLVAPGLASDLVGLVLLTPAVRSQLARRYFAPVRTPQPGVVDLDPDEWRSAREQHESQTCEPRAGMLPGEPKNAHSRRRDDE